MPLLTEVILANALTRLLALAAAYRISQRSLARWGERLLGVACGFLVTLSLTHLLPEAVETAGRDAHALGWVMLGTLVFLALLTRTGRCAHGGAPREHAGTSPAALLTGAFLHNVVDGTLVAAAFLADGRAGWLAAFAVLLHEIPQQTGYFVILRGWGYSERAALWRLSILTLGAVAGGVAGTLAVGASAALLPYLLAASGAAFLFIAAAVLLPEALRCVRTSADRWRLAAALLLGAALSAGLLGFGHGHEHAGGSGETALHAAH